MKVLTTALIASVALVSPNAAANASATDSGVSQVRTKLTQAIASGDSEARRTLADFNNLPVEQQRQFADVVNDPQKLTVAAGNALKGAASQKEKVAARSTSPKVATAAAVSTWNIDAKYVYRLFGVYMGTFTMNLGWTFSGTKATVRKCQDTFSGTTALGEWKYTRPSSQWVDNGGALAHCQQDWTLTVDTKAGHSVSNYKHHAWGYPYGAYQQEFPQV